MPLFDFLCLECNQVAEILLTGSEDVPICKKCGSRNVKRLLSAPSSLSGNSRQGLPGPMDTACCGSKPGSASNCAGPGSCCGGRF